MAKNVVKEIRRATRRKFSAEEKIRIVLEGLRGEVPISDVCQRQASPRTISDEADLSLNNTPRYVPFWKTVHSPCRERKRLEKLSRSCPVLIHLERTATRRAWPRGSRALSKPVLW